MDTTASEFVVALDIGSARTRCLIARVAGDSTEIVGRGDQTSRGVRRGEIIDLPAAQYATRRALADAEEQAGLEVQTLFLAAGGRHVGFFNNRACIGITREDRTVTQKDVANVLASARRVPLRDDTVALATIICSYAVDDVRKVHQAVGMHGTRLEAELHVITDARTAVENIVSCVDATRHFVEDRIFAPYAAGEAALDDDEKKLGVALVNIGAGTTGLMLYRDNAPVFSSVVPVGGDHITNDVAAGLGLGLADAAKLKDEHATVDPAAIGHPILFRRVTRDDTLSIDPRRLYTIVDCRAREILDIVRREILRAGVRPAAIRIVLTGGTSRLPGLENLAANLLACPARIGRPRLSPDGPPFGPELATAVGILRVGVRVRKHQPQAPLPYAGTGKIFAWLKHLF